MGAVASVVLWMGALDANASGSNIAGDLGLKVFVTTGPGFGGELSAQFDSGVAIDFEYDYTQATLGSLGVASTWITGGLGYVLRKDAARLRFKGRLGAINSSLAIGPAVALDFVIGGSFTIGANASLLFANGGTSNFVGAGIGFLF